MDFLLKQLNQGKTASHSALFLYAVSIACSIGFLLNAAEEPAKNHFESLHQARQFFTEDEAVLQEILNEMEQDNNLDAASKSLQAELQNILEKNRVLKISVR